MNSKETFVEYNQLVYEIVYNLYLAYLNKTNDLNIFRKDLKVSRSDTSFKNEERNELVFNDTYTVEANINTDSWSKESDYIKLTFTLKEKPIIDMEENLGNVLSNSLDSFHLDINPKIGTPMRTSRFAIHDESLDFLCDIINDFNTKGGKSGLTKIANEIGVMKGVLESAR